MELERFVCNKKGLTLAELMVTTFILSVVVLAAMGSYRYISTSSMLSKSRTLASNLEQEQIEKLKNITYYSLLVTTSAYSDTRFYPPLSYDTGNYPAQTIVEGGVSFTRGTRIDFAYKNGSQISTAPWTTDDTALKQITTYVIWNENNVWKYVSMQNLIANPAASELSATASGQVTDTGGVAIAGALVQILDNPNWFAYTDTGGNYQFSVSPGSYTVQASSTGYYPSTTNGYQTFTSGVTTPINFALGAVASGTVSGMVYSDDHLVISQVVASTDTGGGSEYIELYNPTTAAINIGYNTATYWSPAGKYFFAYDHNNSGTLLWLTLISTYVPANSYYLIANTTTVNAGGIRVTADAVYNNSFLSLAPSHVMDLGDAGGIAMYNWPGGTTVDRVGWTKNSSGHGSPGSATESFGIGSGNGASAGINAGEQFIRSSRPGGYSTGQGRAYDSDDNNKDFLDLNPITASPHNTSTSELPVSGTPATGATVNMNDILSNIATCTDTTVSSGQRVCSYSLIAATGTWTMDITLNGLAAQVQNVVMQASVSTTVPNGSTVPTWTSVGMSSTTLLRSTTDFAIVTGYIYNGTGGALPSIKVSDGNGHSTQSSSTGFFSLLTSTGAIQMTANPNDGTMNKMYVSQSHDVETFLAGTLYDNRNFTLSYGAIIRGYFQTSSNTALPHRTAIAKKNGLEVAEAASDNTGYFYLANLATGTYAVEASVDPLESVVPSSMTVVINSTGTSTTVSTFTIISGIADIQGQVTVSGNAIKTGVLVLATTTTLTSSALPPAITTSGGGSCNPCYYAGSSNASGFYDLQVRNSAVPYKVYGWYTSFSLDVPSTTVRGPYSVTVNSAGQVGTQPLSW